MKLCCELIYFIGARPSEIRKLKWSQFDDINGRLNLSSKDTKEDSAKSLKLNERLTIELIKLRETQKRKDIPHIFRNVSGQGRLMATQFYNGWKQTMQELGFVTTNDKGNIECIYHPHDMRRTRVTQLLDAGENIATVMMQTGHKRPDILLKIYNRSNHEKQDAMVERIDDIDKKLYEQQTAMLQKAEERRARIEAMLRDRYWTVDTMTDLDDAKREFKLVIDDILNELK
jgi:integrase